MALFTVKTVENSEKKAKITHRWFNMLKLNLSLMKG